MTAQGEPPARVHATVWCTSPVRGRAGAIDAIGARWPGAAGFDVHSLTILDPSPDCPFDLGHPDVLASGESPGEGPGWVWILHDPGTAPPLLPAVGEPGTEGGDQ